MLPSNASDWEVSNPPPKKGRRGFGGLALMLGLLIVLGAVVFVAVTRLPTGSLSRATAPNESAPGQAKPAPAAAGAPADAATPEALQQSIPQLDDAPAEAVATRNTH